MTTDTVSTRLDKFDWVDVSWLAAGILVVFSTLPLWWTHGPGPFLTVIAWVSLGTAFMLESASRTFTSKSVALLESLSTAIFLALPAIIFYMAAEYWGGILAGLGGFILGGLLTALVLQRDLIKLRLWGLGALMFLSFTVVVSMAVFVPPNRLITVAGETHLTDQVEFLMPWEHERIVLDPTRPGQKDVKTATGNETWEVQLGYNIPDPKKLGSTEWAAYLDLQEKAYTIPNLAGEEDPAGAVFAAFEAHYPFLKATEVTVTRIAKKFKAVSNP